MRGVPNAPGPSLTLGLLGPSHQWRHKSQASLRGPPCAHGVAGTPQGEVHDIVGQVEVVVTPESDQASPAESEVYEEAEGTRGDEVSSKESDTMPSTTRLKYSRFKGDGSQDVDDWLIELKSTAMANQEELATTLRISQGLLKGEALKWYQDILDRI